MPIRILKSRNFLTNIFLDMMKKENSQQIIQQFLERLEQIIIYSISDIHLMQLYEELCLATTNNMRCSSLNRRSALQKLFAVKYFVLPTKTEYIPEYMTFVKEFDTYAEKKKLYRLNNSLITNE